MRAYSAVCVKKRGQMSTEVSKCEISECMKNFNIQKGGQVGSKEFLRSILSLRVRTSGFVFFVAASTSDICISRAILTVPPTSYVKEIQSWPFRGYWSRLNHAYLDSLILSPLRWHGSKDQRPQKLSFTLDSVGRENCGWKEEAVSLNSFLYYTRKKQISVFTIRVQWMPFIFIVSNFVSNKQIRIKGEFKKKF